LNLEINPLKTPIDPPQTHNAVVKTKNGVHTHVDVPQSGRTKRQWIVTQQDALELVGRL
jgi:hypothetical protein